MDYLLVEHKDVCWDCDLMRIDEIYGIPFCGRTGGKVEMHRKPDWCPLHPLPEKMLTWHDDEQDDYEMGWNACLDAITGEEEE